MLKNNEIVVTIHLETTRLSIHSYDNGACNEAGIKPRKGR